MWTIAKYKSIDSNELLELWNVPSISYNKRKEGLYIETNTGFHYTNYEKFELDIHDKIVYLYGDKNTENKKPTNEDINW